MKIIWLASICFLGISSMSSAQNAVATTWQHYLNVNVTSHHFSNTKRYNEFNPGLGYEGVFGNNHILLGVYYNSFKLWSGYALGAYTPLHWQVSQNHRIDFGLALGLASGYQDVHLNWTKAKCCKGIVPLAGAMVMWKPVQSDKFGVNFFLVPKFKRSESEMAGFIGLQLKFKLPV